MTVGSWDPRARRYEQDVLVIVRHLVPSRKLSGLEVLAVLSAEAIDDARLAYAVPDDPGTRGPEHPRTLEP